MPQSSTTPLVGTRLGTMSAATIALMQKMALSRAESQEKKIQN
ncbi:MAG: hypothetical protein PHD02_01250 [Bacilli bacterium]|nr:hypothetical protein [Bacilli bacterium]